jgi:CRISPR-associated Csx14 family protein
LEQAPLRLSVLAPIGTSPPVITEFVQYVEKVLRERITYLAVISTKDPYILSCTDLAEQAVKDRYPHIMFFRYELDFEDIDTQDRLQKFMLNTTTWLKEQVRDLEANKIYVNAAGGRKDAVITLSMLCQFLFIPVAGVFHIIMPEVRAFNIELEKARALIEGFETAEDKKSYYEKNKKVFGPLMFPPLEKYSVIKMPVVSFPLDVLVKLAKILHEDRTEISKAGLDPIYLRMLTDIGIIRMDSKHLYPTDEGKFIRQLIEAIWHPYLIP